MATTNTNSGGARSRNFEQVSQLDEDALYLVLQYRNDRNDIEVYVIASLTQNFAVTYRSV